MSADPLATPDDGPRWSHGARREALIEAAIRVVAEGGLRRLTYRSVAAEAGVAHGLVRHHFGSIDALIEEALIACIAETRATISLDPPSGDPGDFARGLIESLQREPEAQLFQYEVMLESRRTEALQQPVESMLTLYKSVVRDGMRRMGLAADAASVELVYAALEGIVLQQAVRGETQGTDMAIDSLRRMLAQLKPERR